MYTFTECVSRAVYNMGQVTLYFDNVGCILHEWCHLSRWCMNLFALSVQWKRMYQCWNINLHMYRRGRLYSSCYVYSATFLWVYAVLLPIIHVISRDSTILLLYIGPWEYIAHDGEEYKCIDYFDHKSHPPPSQCVLSLFFVFLLQRKWQYCTWLKVRNDSAAVTKWSYVSTPTLCGVYTAMAGLAIKSSDLSAALSAARHYISYQPLIFF